jgi:hypothetical protein
MTVGDPLSFIEGLMARLNEPMKVPFIREPTIATSLAVPNGRKDALMRKAPCFWTLFTEAKHRRELLLDGWKTEHLSSTRQIVPGSGLVVSTLPAIC